MGMDKMLEVASELGLGTSTGIQLDEVVAPLPSEERHAKSIESVSYTHLLGTGILLSIRTKFIQIRCLPRALVYMFTNEPGAEGEVSSFGALCTALAATIGTGNIVGVATAVTTGGPGALFWMIVAAFFGMATKYSEGVLAIKYRDVAEDGHSLGGPFLYIEKGMGPQWKWLAKAFAIFACLAGILATGTTTPVSYTHLQITLIRSSYG